MLFRSPGAFIYCGFKKHVSKEEVEERIRENTVTEILNKVPVAPGDVYFISAGTVHAIGSGILICEIQQSSACTYRMYDYGRKDRFGNYRELHVQKALDVMDCRPYVPQKFEAGVEKWEHYESRLLCCCKYFISTHYHIIGEMELAATEESFISIVCIKGNGRLGLKDGEAEEMNFQAGESMFLPKSEKIYRIAGECEVIVTRV